MSKNKNGTLFKVWEVQVLKRGYERCDEAKALLERAVAQVQPLLLKRKWKVRLVREFFPKSQNLLGLNVNRGQKILIRLRRRKKGDFYPFEFILGTLLHELCHNEIGPHNKAFRKLLEEITTETENNMMSGVYGNENFLGSGKKLDKSQINARNKRQAMARAAQKRAKLGALMPTGGQRLGGKHTEMPASSMARLAALLRQGASIGDQAEGKDARSLNGGSCHVVTGGRYTRCIRRFDSMCGCVSCAMRARPPSSSSNARSARTDITQQCSMACSQCTFLNHRDLSRCEICDFPLASTAAPDSTRTVASLPPRSTPNDATEMTRQCSTACPQCTFLNHRDLSRCEICDFPLASTAAHDSARTVHDSASLPPVIVDLTSPPSVRGKRKFPQEIPTGGTRKSRSYSVSK